MLVFGQAQKHFFFIYEYYGNDRQPIVLDSISKDSIGEMSKSIKKVQKRFVDSYCIYKKTKTIVSKNKDTQKIFDQNMETLISVLTDYLPYNIIKMNNEGLEEELCYYINRFSLLLKKGARKEEIDTTFFQERMNGWYNNLDIILAYFLIK